MDRDICIIGGGIAGLAVATALAQRGARVRVLEQAAQIAEVGAGLQISPNGAQVLRAFGLGAEVAQLGRRAQGVSLRDYAQGRQVTRLDLTRLDAGQGYYLLHRADLIALLERAARRAGAQIDLGVQVQSVDVAGGRIAAQGKAYTADMILGADGLHSMLRPMLNSAAKPFFTGQVAWRAIVPNTVNHPDEAQVHMGKGRHLVSYPLRDGAMVNLVAVLERAEWQGEGWQQTGPASDMRAAFADFGGAVPKLMQGLPNQVGLWGLFRHPVAQVWSQGKAALLGDAAHPTLPFLAQGANLALEDAWALAHCITAGDLPRYQDLRKARVQRVIAAANGNARKYHLRNPVVRGMAHMGLGAIGTLAPGRLLHSFDWLYRYDITQELPLR